MLYRHNRVGPLVSAHLEVVPTGGITCNNLKPGWHYEEFRALPAKRPALFNTMAFAMTYHSVRMGYFTSLSGRL